MTMSGGFKINKLHWIELNWIINYETITNFLSVSEDPVLFGPVVTKKGICVKHVMCPFLPAIFCHLDILGMYMNENSLFTIR